MTDTWQKNDYVDFYNRVYFFKEKEVQDYLSPLRLVPDDCFVDFGCGEARALKAASAVVNLAVGIDVSKEQLRRAEEELRGADNVQLIEGEFLSCDLGELLFTKGAARKSLHHLTDIEKAIFFRKISKHFAPGALFIIEDGIFDFKRDELQQNMPRILTEAPKYYGKKWDEIEESFLATINEEFPTGAVEWSEALKAACFRTLEVKQRTCFYGSILAQKEVP